MRKAAHFFLGANSCRGFSSLYDGLKDGQLDDLMILKGGPGCGKSTFMRQIAKRCEQAGEVVDYIHCSGDPQSLDGIIVPGRRIGIVDGTSPHVVEPTYAIVRERYVDFSRFYDLDRVKTQKESAVLYYKQYQECYRDTYRILRAFNALETERRKLLDAHTDTKQAARRLNDILKGVANNAETGKTAEIFLGGLTHEGAVCRYDTADALCKQIYEIVDPYGMADVLLSDMARAMEMTGEKVVICRDPLVPERPAHLIMPERSVAIVTSNPLWHYPKKPTHRIRLDATAEKNLTRAERGKLHLLGRLQNSLCEEAILHLKQAKASHDLLEAVYHPYVDFTAVSELAEEEANRIIK